MSEQTFKVGDKVVHSVFGPGEIAFGPAEFSTSAQGYVLKCADGVHKVAVLSASMTIAPAFTVGDIVTLRTRDGARAVVEYGPFDDRDVYVVKLVDPPTDPDDTRTFTAVASTLKKVPEDVAPSPALVPIGTRVRVDRAKWAESVRGSTGVVVSNTETWREVRGDVHPYSVRLDDGSALHVAELTPVDDPTDTFEHDGIVYDLSARYEDTDGDTWHFARIDGEVRGEYVPECSIDGYSSTLAYVVRRFGPLKKI
ncbi:phiSA1p31-related protein [Streptomyces sp. NBC_01768]|uniref:phiSA1p31-related protein n=1 Tax=Streptomyces sp. NBC_01768 TaxID=2975938 RepID=UPI002DDC463B|nr:phiSA1p31-related protein [Streptomyces sp. NBC_01768]WSC31814.1 phiSA1p31-related protein [Streptomyces sp. NBC_01768]